MLKGFAIIVDPVYVARTKEIDKILIFAHPFVGKNEMEGYVQELLCKEVSASVLVSKDSLYYYFGGNMPDFFATLGQNGIDEFLNSYRDLEYKVRANRRAKERVRIMALPADNEERIKLEKRDKEDKKHEELIKEFERKGERNFGFDDYGMFERYDFTEHIHKKKLSNYDLFVLYPKYDSKNKIVGWLLD